MNSNQDSVSLLIGNLMRELCPVYLLSWWRHHMETFFALLALCARNSPVTGEFPSQRPVTRSFDVFFDLPPNKRWANNQEARDLRRHCTHYDVVVKILRIFSDGVKCTVVPGSITEAGFECDTPADPQLTETLYPGKTCWNWYWIY